MQSKLLKLLTILILYNILYIYKMPFGFFKTRKRRNSNPKPKSKSKKISPRTRKLQQRIAKTVRTKKDIKIITEIQNKYANKFDECPICFRLMISPSLRQELPCHHTFHTACIAKLDPRNRRCPKCRAFFAPEDILRDLQNKMHKAEDAYDLLNGREIVAREIYEEYVAYLERTNNTEIEDDPELEELARLWREATLEAEAAQSRINAATQAYENTHNEMYDILGA
jgi:hypothetical protein